MARTPEEKREIKRRWNEANRDRIRERARSRRLERLADPAEALKIRDQQRASNGRGKERQRQWVRANYRRRMDAVLADPQKAEAHRRSRRAATRGWRERNPEKIQEMQARLWRDPPTRRHRHGRELARKYGLSFDELDAMLISQGGLCAICKQQTPDLAVDHCHSTGAVRGLLCAPCNVGIGLFKDDPRRVMAAMAYLARRKGVWKQTAPGLYEPRGSVGEALDAVREGTAT